MNVDRWSQIIRIVTAIEAHVESLIRIQVEIEIETNGVRPPATLPSIALPYMRSAT